MAKSVIISLTATAVRSSSGKPKYVALKATTAGPANKKLFERLSPHVHTFPITYSNVVRDEDPKPGVNQYKVSLVDDNSNVIAGSQELASVDFSAAAAASTAYRWKWLVGVTLALIVVLWAIKTVVFDHKHWLTNQQLKAYIEAEVSQALSQKLEPSSKSIPVQVATTSPTSTKSVPETQPAPSEPHIPAPVPVNEKDTWRVLKPLPGERLDITYWDFGCPRTFTTHREIKIRNVHDLPIFTFGPNTLEQLTGLTITDPQFALNAEKTPIEITTANGVHAKFSLERISADSIAGKVYHGDIEFSALLPGNTGETGFSPILDCDFKITVHETISKPETPASQKLEGGSEGKPTAPTENLPAMPSSETSSSDRKIIDGPRDAHGGRWAYFGKSDDTATEYYIPGDVWRNPDKTLGFVDNQGTEHNFDLRSVPYHHITSERKEYRYRFVPSGMYRDN